MKANILIAVITIFLTLTINAQNDTMYVMKGGEVVGKYDVNTDIDSIIFYKPEPHYSTFTDPRDGKTYITVEIGDQTWFAENLNFGTMIDDSLSIENNSIVEKYCMINDEAYCDIYGGLYQWDEMMQYTTAQGAQGICPSGWHIAKNEEWNVLIDYLGGKLTAGGRMKETGIMHWAPPNTGATNSSGFTALPGGYRSSNGGTTCNLNHECKLWTSTEDNEMEALRQVLHYSHKYVLPSIYLKTHGLSVRCLKD